MRLSRKLSLLSVSLAFFGINHLAGAQEVRIDFGSSSYTTASTTGKNWTNITNPNYGTTTLKDFASGAAMPWTLSVTNDFGSGIRTNGTTAPTGTASSLFPVSATRDAFATAFGDKGEITLNKLNPAHTYRLQIFGSNMTNYWYMGSNGSYSTAGATTTTKTYNAQGNKTNVLSFNNIKPSSTGALKLGISNASYWNNAYLNAMQIVDTTPVEVGKNLLFFGNSFTMMNDMTPSIAEIAVADKHVRPNIVMEAGDSRTLGDAITEIQTDPSTNINALPTGQKWDNVVMQEYSTGATTKLGDPAKFKADSKSVYSLVKAHSPSVKPVLYETWSYMASDTNVFGSLSYQYANQAEMQADIKANYAAAAAEINALSPTAGAVVAPVGDDWGKLNWADDLYFGFDTKHPSARGSLIASLDLYKKIYGENVSDIPWSAVQTWYQVRSITQADWTQLTRLVDGLAPLAPASLSVSALSVSDFASVPEPTSISMLALGAAMLLRRARRA